LPDDSSPTPRPEWRQQGTQRLLFVPVSGAYGMGEYARSLAIARAAIGRWPQAEIRFLLSKQAPYAASVPFSATLLPSSPTFHSAEVIRELRAFRPHVVIFDNAGRTAQLRAARRVEARIVYISARSRQRAKAFRWRWMRLIDEHWIAYPRFIAGALGPWERFKLRLLRRPMVRYLDVILARAAPQTAALPLHDAAGSYVLVVPGGGTGHPGAHDAVAQFRSAASSLAAAGAPTLFVGPAGDDSSEAIPAARLRCLAPLPQEELMTLMRAARLVIANGGSTLLQGIACGCACVAVPIAGDQKQRIDACVAAQVALASSLRAADIVATAQALLHDEPRRSALASRAAALHLADGVEIAINALAALAACAS
jgi:ADP-heptose:LPS heptosyltransferase